MVPPRWPKPARIALRIVYGVIIAIFLVWLILFITKGRFLKRPFESITSGLSQRQVRVDGDFQLYFNPINITFRAEGLHVRNPDWATKRDFFYADRIDADIATFSFLFGHRRVNTLALDNGSVDLEWDQARTHNSWTFGDSKKKGEPLDLPVVTRARFAGTTLRYRDPQSQLSADIAFDTVNTNDTHFNEAIRLRGTGRARGTAFTLVGALLSPNETVSGGRNRLALNIRSADSRADITGTLPGATQIDGADLHADVRGGNLANLFAVAGVAIPDTRSYHLTSAVTKAGDEWRLTGLKGTFGDSDISGKLTVRLGQPRLKLIGDLSTDKLDIVDVGPFIGYDPNKLATKGASGAVTQVSGHPRVLPDAQLRIDALKNFDADVKYRVRTIRAPNLPVSNVDLALTLDNRLLKLSPLTFDMARGHVSSDIAIDARKNPVLTDYDIRLSPTPMGVLLAGWGVEQSGTSGVLKARIKMTGRGNSVHDSLSHADGRIAIIMPKGTFWARNAQLAEIDIGTFVQKMFENKLKEPVHINCGLIGFTVRNGVAAADPILIDTSKNVMIGRGGFSFRNEAMDLAFRADSKKVSLFSGQSPVGIGGYFAKPSIDPISGDLLARAGSAVGLGLVATPLASVLSFVDIGDAKSAACGPVLAGARANAQRTTKGEKRDDVGNGTTAKSEDGKQDKGDAKKQRKKFLGIF
ncbi:AsmA family protein [Stakelama sp. CBK3Z-3]|uniref:AsmA family protein n=1 Tax=Stakelama flava TaxID=2860338 RepID=A0ABS6XMF9_9SPHN|nr:AsmA family protein [Stakelama flava]MBW4330630.1 AsmA family protein [Stakelama flava]